MKPVVERHSVRFFNIQPQLSAEERAVLAGLPGVEDLGPLLTDFNETAALVCELDLIISIDTSTAHLAGALGHPAWVMLSFPPDWRWHLDRDDSPWYDSLRLFRQERSGDWRAASSALRRRWINMSARNRACRRAGTNRRRVP